MAKVDNVVHLHIVLTYRHVKTTGIPIYTPHTPRNLYREQMNALPGNSKLIVAIGYFLNVRSLANISKNNC